ncbi:HEXXH motif-containing putative peptide modification protein [Diaminobutyricimonas sp. LJ205]|uniref:aKG-HExxH-type peptide beta-hydroxylase n=1 Tax=Diaminobutyricimonas sp. LJ205 TaxID=2683590 RepID=UPI001E5C980F|nr:HEXXH motif-containing putative peptide modification protein [Diaminobutyricimonas sp. LJ205]
MLGGQQHESVVRSLEFLRLEDSASIVRRFTSPLFLNWFSRFGRVQRWEADDHVLAYQLARWNNMTVSPTFWQLGDEIPMAVDGGLVLTADPRIALPVPSESSASGVRLRASGDEITLFDSNGVSLGARGWDDLLTGADGYCLLPGDVVVGRNDLDPLRLRIRSDVAPERYGTVLEAADPSAEAYPDFDPHQLLRGAALLAVAWPEEYAELKLMVQIVVPRGIPAGWERPRHSFTVGSYQGAVWLALDPDSAIVAEGLVHEKGHIKLRYIQDQWPLLDQTRSDELFTVGWRTDPRPLVGVLEGVFVHSQIAELLARIIGGGYGTPSQLEARAIYLDEVRAEVSEGLEMLSGHSALTDFGIELLRSIEARAFPS